MNGRFTELCRDGNFIWYWRPYFDEYELQHVGIGTVLTIEGWELDTVQGSTKVEKLWNLARDMLFEHFANVDGAGQRALVRRAFSLK